MNFDTFLETVYPTKWVSLRKDKGPLWKVGKWSGIRIAYVLYRLGITANIIDLFGILMSVVAFVFLLRALQGEKLLPVLGILLIDIHMLIDFIDGSVARARRECSLIGWELDEIGCELDRVLLLALFGIYSGHPFLILLNVFSGFMIFELINPTWDFFPEEGFVGKLKHIYRNRLSINSVRVMLGLLMAFLGVVIVLGLPLEEIATGISIFYGVSMLVWLIFCLLSAGMERKAG